MAKSILERILGNAMTRVGTTMLTRVMTPVVNKALDPVKPATNPQQSFYVNMNKGFIRKRRTGENIVFDFVIDMREATSFHTFQQADNAAKNVVRSLQNNKCWYAIVQPTIGCGY